VQAFPADDAVLAYGYQNLMYIAWRVIERVSEDPGRSLSGERILLPLNMNGTETSIREFKPAINIAMPNESGGKLRVVHYGTLMARLRRLIQALRTWQNGLFAA